MGRLQRVVQLVDALAIVALAPLGEQIENPVDEALGEGGGSHNVSIGTHAIGLYQMTEH